MERMRSVTVGCGVPATRNRTRPSEGRHRRVKVTIDGATTDEEQRKEEE